MLVLSRRIGQQIYIPDYGVAIEVLDIQGSRVRIGIAAPSGVPIVREELRDRLRGTGPLNGQRDGAAKSRSPDGSSTRHEASAPDPDAVSRTAQLARWIAQRTCGRVRSLSVSSDGTRWIIEGSASSYYARQLAQTAAREFLDAHRGKVRGEIEFQIDVLGADRASARAATRSGRGGEMS